MILLQHSIHPSIFNYHYYHSFILLTIFVLLKPLILEEAELFLSSAIWGEHTNFEAKKKMLLSLPTLQVHLLCSAACTEGSVVSQDTLKY